MTTIVSAAWSMVKWLTTPRSSPRFGNNWISAWQLLLSTLAGHCAHARPVLLIVQIGSLEEPCAYRTSSCVECKR